MERKHRIHRYIRIASCILLCLYLLFIARRMFFHAYGTYYRSYSAAPEYNLIPFKTITSLIVNFKYYELEVWIYNLFGNVGAFLPLGFLLPAALGAGRKLPATMIYSLIFLLAAETAQLAFRVGVFDVDDIILNMIGVLIGYTLYKAILRLNGSKL